MHQLIKLLIALREAGLLSVGAAENVVRLLPPLIVGTAEIDEAVGVLESVAQSYSVRA